MGKYDEEIRREIDAFNSIIDLQWSSRATAAAADYSAFQFYNRSSVFEFFSDLLNTYMYSFNSIIDLQARKNLRNWLRNGESFNSIIDLLGEI